MAAVIVSDPLRTWQFVRQYVPVAVSGDMKAIGLERDGELVAGALYEGCSGPSVWVHIALKPGTLCTRQFLWRGFGFPFVDLGCKRISGYIEARNAASRRVAEHLGFKQEAVLRGAASDGGDSLIYVMWRQECRFLKGGRDE